MSSNTTWSNLKFDYRDAHVLVTGGSNGIGAGIAAAYRDAGAQVIITGTRPRAADYEGDFSGYRYLQLELADSEQIKALADALPRLDILVNNAGCNFAAQDESNPAMFDKSVQANLLSPYHLAHACRDKLARSTLPGGASVIGMASMTSYFGVESVPGYGAAKAGIVQMTKTLAVAWARDNIRVNAVAPGFIRSNMMQHFEATPAMHDPVLARTPMKRMGDPRDIAGAVLFLTSAAAGFITGQTLPVDGGYSVVG
ncbi:SDR family NAD(P)-dependent oxidoreductase [Denitratisoma oestradiolicum]|uniref:Short-chain dehydrogenase n=1 Tax=Denitratisoma oestradiolicum TaxID=311182 RepID=A0A6S6YQP3_9PROT|nr:SDR family oxidoreductase [Denitratisoma oestradiolicum]TWO80076.1 short-chain dehydrogenase [Denitratisoma oestradiolicum]CAB1370092.1 Short-chain dehydrogenase [Denitratisoma oestradiolicum]